MNIRETSGRQAKKEGHDFEHIVAQKLTEDLNVDFEVEGASNTKIDVRDINSKVRFSVKNPKGKNTQIGLYTQHSFIEAMNIVDSELIDFIQKFFGGDKYMDLKRHRMTRKQIDPYLNEKFTYFLNENTPRLLDLLATHGHNQIGDVNYLIWAMKKNDPNSIVLIDLEEFKQNLLHGEWTQNETTFAFNVNDKKLFHLQMKGSGKSKTGPGYGNGYHSLMFHIHRNFDDKYVKELSVLNGLV